MSASPESDHPDPSRESLHTRSSERTTTYRSADLLGNRDEVDIEHAGERYRLRRTRQNKLILTK